MDKGPRASQALDQALVEKALVDARGNVRKAAKALGVPPLDLREHVRAVPALFDLALEIEEQRLDAAEAVIRRSLRAGPLASRLIAAHAVLTMAGKLGTGV